MIEIPLAEEVKDDKTSLAPVASMLLTAEHNLEKKCFAGTLLEIAKLYESYGFRMGNQDPIHVLSDVKILIIAEIYYQYRDRIPVGLNLFSLFTKENEQLVNSDFKLVVESFFESAVSPSQGSLAVPTPVGGHFGAPTDTSTAITRTQVMGVNREQLEVPVYFF